MAFEADGKGSCMIDGVDYPAVGFGTWKLKGDVCTQAVLEAYSKGYRIFDTATLYRNFGAIRKSLEVIEREKIYLISKVWPDMQTAENVKKDLETCLEELGTDYIDAYFIHWPNSKIPHKETLNAMDALRKEGKIRHIGMSNVTVHHLRKALELSIPIEWVQVEMHPHFYDNELLEFCAKHSIAVQAWAPLARGAVCDQEDLINMGHKYGKTAAQVALRWAIQHGCIPLPGSKNPQHIEENFTVTDFALSDEEMHSLDERAKRGSRNRITEDMGLGFEDEFDLSYEECYPNI